MGICEFSQRYFGTLGNFHKNTHIIFAKYQNVALCAGAGVLRKNLKERKMVIINKPTAKRFRRERTKKPFAKVLAVVLTLVMLVSVVMFAIPTISALKCSYFTHQETIYIDLTGFTGWEDSNAKIRVYTYYGDTDDDWNVENGAADSGIYNNACYQKAITPSSVSDHLYSFNIQGDRVGYVKVMRLDSGLNEKWNDTGFVYNKDRQGSQNCIKITGWDNSYQWSLYSAGGAGSTGYHEVNATPDANSITNNANIFPIDATFYDYYTDGEIQNGWGNITYVQSHGNWEPYQTLNNKIAAASSGVPYPMYFGNFFDKNDGYTGAGSSNMVNFSNWVNNSARLGGTHKSVVGLTGTDLVDGNLKYATNNGGTSDVNVPFFDKSFLKSNGVGAVVNTKFPMRKVTEHGITTYIFDSTNATDNAWFSADKTTMYYGQGTSKGAKDALYYYSNPKTASGYGFFPLDSNRGANTEALNFAFGMRVDIPFNLGGDEGHYGQIKGNNNQYYDQKFTFTGDDDVWVYIDGKLVLDLGGDHQKAKGTINFAGGRGTGTVNVETEFNTVNNATRNTSFSINNYDPTVEHTLTMFYVERGMVESNLSFDFNFAPIGNELIVDKTVNTADVNNSATFKAAVAAADTFSFNQPTANGKQSTKGQISNSTYTLKNAESISFKDQFDVPTTMKVTESYSGNMSYTTSWKAVDLVLKGKGQAESAYTIASDSNKEANFVYQTKDTSSDFVMTRVQLSYVNTPAVAPITITKTVTELDSGETDNTEFGGTVYVDLGDGFKTYNLAYTTSDGGSATLTSAGKLADSAKLKNGRTLTFAGIPQGAKVKFVEDNTDVEHQFVSVTVGSDGIVVGSDGIVVGSSDNAMTVTNKKLKPGEISVPLTAKKTLENASLTDGAFEFELLDSSKNVIETQSCTATGDVTFSARNYTGAANETYYIREKVPAASNDSDMQSYDTSEYKVSIVVTKSGLVLTPTVTYSKNNQTVSAVTFTNTVKLGEAYVIKSDTAYRNVSGVEFAIYKVDSNGASLAGVSPFRTAKTKEMDITNTDGSTQRKTAVHFTDLPLYADDKYYADKNSRNYQWYAIAETDPTTGYFKNNTVFYFQLPQSGSYEPKFKYVNGHILSPEAGFGGMFGMKMIGVYAITFAALMGAAYLFYTKRNRRKARHIMK